MIVEQFKYKEEYREQTISQCLCLKNKKVISNRKYLSYRGKLASEFFREKYILNINLADVLNYNFTFFLLDRHTLG